MFEIDGARGEGGGQVLRTALTLSLCQGEPVRIKNIRAGRQKPGLLRQHLACLRAAKAISHAQVSGEQLGSREVVFMPGKVESGKYHFAVGSAGSTSLVLQTVLLPLLYADGVSEIHIEGGTHNKKAPSFDFIARAYLPLLARMGAKVTVELHKYGFYPAGGGAMCAHIQPLPQLSSLDLSERGALVDFAAVATSANIPGHIAQRELAQVRKKCDWSPERLHQQSVPSVGPGNVLSLRLHWEQVSEVFDAMAELGVTAENVTRRAIGQMQRYLHAGVPVGEHLADQLLLPMALGSGGCFRTLKPSQHLLTNIQVIRDILGTDIQLHQQSDDDWQVIVEGTNRKLATGC
ncbi:RNA 3'-terminal phosphate cyclase [Microbulbifer discodermiae]|uniref:RNA 3'-terminal phosphate cyclase n=1 Tax=Microbulbifer sp. 2201CG32-9 TaxID=3232309 RepID=UPI00345BAECF